MKSGLYDRAGDSATDWAAAWANRLEEAITKVSKVYRGSSTGEPPGAPDDEELAGAGRKARDPEGWTGGSVPAEPVSGSWSSSGAMTSRCTVRSRPRVPATVSWMSARNRDSTRSRISLLGTPSRISCSLMDNGVIPDR